MITIAILSALVILLFRFDSDSPDESNGLAVAGGADPGSHERRRALNPPASTRPATA
jgi:hypothetical protein